MELVFFEQNNQTLFSFYLVSGILSAIISGYFLKIYRIFPSSQISALLIGFSLVSFGDLLFSGSLSSIKDDDMFNFLHWLQLSFATSGFAFIGLVYFFQRIKEKSFSLIVKTMFAIVILAGTNMAILEIQNTNAFPAFQNFNEYFRFVNVVMIGIFIYKAMNNLALKNKKDRILIPAGFAILFLGQFDRLFFTLGPNNFSLIGSVVLQVSGLSVILYGLLRKSKQKMEVPPIRFEK